MICLRIFSIRSSVHSFRLNNHLLSDSILLSNMYSNTKGNQKNKKKVKKSANKNHHEKQRTQVSKESVTPSQSKPKEDLHNLKKIEIASTDVTKSNCNDGANSSNSRDDPFYRTKESKHSNDTLIEMMHLSKLDKNGKSEIEKSYDMYMDSIRLKKNMKYNHVTEIEADLFSMDKEYHLGHCVAEDFNMGSGIALQFRKQFKDVGLLLNQRVRQGGFAVLESEGRYIYYLVTKRESNGKPTLETMFKSVYKMKAHIVKNNVKKLALPRIGCGLDRLEWSDVKNMLEFVFEDTECIITICNFQKAQDSMSEAQSNHRSRKCKVTNISDVDITDIEKYAIIIYLGSEDSKITPQIRKLDSKFNIMQNYMDSPKIGTNVLTNVRNGTYLLYGCIVKKRERDPVDFMQFSKCIAEINKKNNQLDERYYYVAMLKEHDGHDDLLMNKIVNLMRNCFYDVDILLYPNPFFPKGIRRKRKMQPYQCEQSTFKKNRIQDYFKYVNK